MDEQEKLKGKDNRIWDCETQLVVYRYTNILVKAIFSTEKLFSGTWGSLSSQSDANKSKQVGSEQISAGDLFLSPGKKGVEK